MYRFYFFLCFSHFFLRSRSKKKVFAEDFCWLGPSGGGGVAFLPEGERGKI